MSKPFPSQQFSSQHEVSPKMLNKKGFSFILKANRDYIEEPNFLIIHCLHKNYDEQEHFGIVESNKNCSAPL